MNRIHRILPAMLLMCGSARAQLAHVDAGYVTVVDRSGAPIYTAQARVQALQWLGRADANGRIQLPPMPVAGELLITAPGFRPLVVQSGGSVIAQHKAVLDVGGGSTVEVQPSPASPEAAPLPPIETGLSAEVPMQALPKRVGVSSGVMAGQAVKRPWPVYPEEARKLHFTGSVVMHVVVGRDGKVLEVTPVSGPEVLRKPYCDAVRQWEFRPFLLNGEAVEVESTVTLILDMGAG